jgi:hypothetical protein
MNRQFRKRESTHPRSYILHKPALTRDDSTHPLLQQESPPPSNGSLIHRRIH